MSKAKTTNTTKKRATTSKKPSLDKIIKPTNKKPIKEKKEEDMSKEELLAELERLKKSRGGRPKTDPMDKTSVRVNFYITPRQEKQLREILDFDGRSISRMAKHLLMSNLDKSDEK